jgi:hypothetical protein
VVIILKACLIFRVHPVLFPIMIRLVIPVVLVAVVKDMLIGISRVLAKPLLGVLLEQRVMLVGLALLRDILVVWVVAVLMASMAIWVTWVALEAVLVARELTVMVLSHSLMALPLFMGMSTLGVLTVVVMD